MKKHLSITAVLFLFLGFQAVAQNELKKASWLLGEWGNITAEGKMLESWKKADDSTFLGKTYFILGKDTVFSEVIRLEVRGKAIQYITQIPNQNGGKPIAFILTKSDDKTLVFENPAHDFPQIITYKRKGMHSISAEISGKQNGKSKTEKFPMKRLTI